MVVVRSVGATSGLPYLAKSMLKLSPTSACSVISCSTARILSWSRTSLGKCTVMGFGFLPCSVAPLHRYQGCVWQILWIVNWPCGGYLRPHQRVFLTSLLCSFHTFLL